MNRKGIVSFITFSLVILTLIILLLLVFYISNYYKLDYTKTISRYELDNVLFDFRESLLELIVKDNSTIIYKNELNSIVNISLYNKSIEGYFNSGDIILNDSISSLGIDFCSNYSFIVGFETKFRFNGSCIELLN